ncbi:MAG: nucleotidyltransferase family protein [Pseudomonadota bacterium]
MTTAAILLAAGHSRRFGPDEKLLAPYDGNPVIAYAADAATTLAPDHLIAVVRSDQVARHLSGFTIVAPAAETNTQSDSLRAGLAEAMRLGADRVLIILGDMPGVTPALMRNVLARASPSTPSAAYDGANILPPVCFPRPWYGRIAGLAGDRGAGMLLRDLPQSQLVLADPALLQDVDTPGDLAAR